ncbi:unnamed protein product [Caenorhabditis brenneri]
MRLNGNRVEHWFFDCGLLAHKVEGEPPTMHFQNTRIRSFSIYGCIYTYAEENNLEYERYAIDLILDLFNCSILNIELEIDGVPEKHRPFLLGSRQCKNLEILGEEVLEAAELRRTLQILKFQNLRLCIPIPLDFSYPVENWNRLDSFVNQCSSAWITGEIFLALKADFIFLRRSSLTTDDCRRFVERWVNSSNNDFTILQIHWAERIPEDLNYDNLGIELLDVDPSREDTFYPDRRETLTWHSKLTFPIVGGKDMVRADGVQATINILHNHFHIGVRKEN